MIYVCAAFCKNCKIKEHFIGGGCWTELWP